MVKQLFLLLFLMILLLGCVPATEPEFAPIPVRTAVPITRNTPMATQTPADRVIVVTRVLEDMEMLGYPIAPLPTATAPYPGPRPENRPTEPRLTATPPIIVYTANGCDLYPSFNRCGGIPLTGKLAYFQPNGRLTVLDLDAETAWISSQINLRDMGWSLQGTLLVHNEDHQTFLYQGDGRIFDYFDYNLRWQPNGMDLRSNTLIWSRNHSTSASITFVETSPEEGGQAVMQRMVRIDTQNGSESGKHLWLVEDPDFRYDVITLLDWVPQTDWLLLGYGQGPVATQIAIGYRLAALNIQTGEIVDSGLSIPIDADINWHPFETGLLLTTDVLSSGLGDLVLWQVTENKVTYPLAIDAFAQSPVWSPNGRYIAYSTLIPAKGFQLEVLDTQTGIARILAENGAWPRWNQDNSMIFYLQMMSESKTAQIRAIGLNQHESLLVADVVYPRCFSICQPRTAFDYMP